jgi:TatD DNase family protein
MTFTKVTAQLEAAKAAPLASIVLETDCPFLTPVPKRGQENEPANIAIIAEFLAHLRGEDVGMFGDATTENAQQLFGLT